MPQLPENYLLISIGIIAFIAIILKSLIMRINYSPIPFYILFGIAIKALFGKWELDSGFLSGTIHIFGDIGLILILFQTGMESNIGRLKKQVSKAMVISVVEVLFSGIIVFYALNYFAGASFDASLIIAISFVATSIAISVGFWRDSKKIDTPLGDLLIDLSAMDDVSAITLMAVAFSLLSSIGGGRTLLELELLGTLAWMCLKLFFLIAIAYFYAEFIEKRLTSFLMRLESVPDPVISIICLTFIFSGLAALFGFSLAIGAFLAGLAYSRDPPAIKLLRTYDTMESFFIPFFFISVGYLISIDAPPETAFVIILAAAAYIGKVFGVSIPAWIRKTSFSGALLLGASMIPRAEITLVVLKYAYKIDALNKELFSAALIAVLITTLAPLFIKPAITRYSTGR